MLLDVALQARSALARDLGVANPPRVTLRLHPTVESYQRATGQPWYTAGATLDTEIHLVPLTVLRERGVLERTIRHEIVHLLTQTELATRPLWVREGTAIYFAGEGAGVNRRVARIRVAGSCVPAIASSGSRPRPARSATPMPGRRPVWPSDRWRAGSGARSGEHEMRGQPSQNASALL